MDDCAWREEELADEILDEVTEKAEAVAVDGAEDEEAAREDADVEGRVGDERRLFDFEFDSASAAVNVDSL